MSIDPEDIESEDEDEGITESHNDQEFDPEDLREVIKNRAQAIDEHYVTLGHHLFIVDEDRLYRKWGFATFADYLTQDVGIGKRRGQRLRQIWKILVRQFGISPTMLSGCRYSNLMTIMGLLRPKIMTADTVEEWVTRAQLLNYTQLVKEVESAKALRKADAEAEITPTTMAEAAEEGSLPEAIKSPTGRKTFQCTNEEANLIDEAIREGTRDGGSDRPGHVLTNICTFFLANRAEDTAMKDYLLSKLTSVFGGRFVHLEDPEMIETWEEHFGDFGDDDDEYEEE